MPSVSPKHQIENVELLCLDQFQDDQSIEISTFDYDMTCQHIKIHPNTSNDLGRFDFTMRDPYRQSKI